MRRISINISFFSLLLALAFAAVALGLLTFYFARANGNKVAAQGPAGALAPGQGRAKPRGLATSQNAYMRWQDPAEGAFSVSLPSGWQVSGGTVRPTRLQPHYVIRAQSPDGGVRMFFDDPNIVIREVPNMMTQQMGYRVGQMISVAGVESALLAPYQPAPQFAAQYAQQTLCPSATQLQGGIISGQTQSLNQQLAPIAQAAGLQLHTDVGEVSFKCGSQVAYVNAITLQVVQPGAPVSMWEVYRIAGFLSTPQEGSAAADAMHTMLDTFQMDQGWLQRFAQECNDVAGMVIRESNAVTQSTIERSNQMAATMAANNAAWKKNYDASFKAIERTDRAITGSSPYGSNGNGHDYNAQLGTKMVCNDVGTCETVDATVDTWYSDCSGKFYPGTSSGGPPPASQSACWKKGS